MKWTVAVLALPRHRRPAGGRRQGTLRVALLSGWLTYPGSLTKKFLRLRVSRGFRS